MSFLYMTHCLKEKKNLVFHNWYRCYRCVCVEASLAVEAYDAMCWSLRTDTAH